MHRESFSAPGGPTDLPGFGTERPISQARDRSSDEATRRVPPRPPAVRHDARGDGVVEVPIEETETMPHLPVQPRSAGVTTVGVDSLPYGMALLVVSHGPNIGARFLLDRDLIVAGRHPDSDIFLDDVTVSRLHAEFRRENGRFVLADTGSLNGTYVNRERVPLIELRTGDEIQIGKFRLTFIMSGREA